MSAQRHPAPPPRSPVAEEPASGRDPGCDVADLLGASTHAVVHRLGPPDARRRGRLWKSPEGTVGLDNAGHLHPVAVDGPVPSRIEPGAPYVEWSYHNVRGHDWHLFLVQGRDRGSQVVADCAEIPAAASA